MAEMIRVDCASPEVTRQRHKESFSITLFVKPQPRTEMENRTVTVPENSQDTSA
jgi:hypothetical protein